MNLDLAQLSRKFDLPADFQAPTELQSDGLVARPLKRSNLADDLAAVNSSIAIIQQTRGGSWPQEPLSEDFDLLDLAWHEREFRDGTSFAYVVYDTAGVYVGCFYLYPMGVRTALSGERMVYDVDASWWVSQAAYDAGRYPELFAALQIWLAQAFPFRQVYYSNRQIPRNGV